MKFTVTNNQPFKRVLPAVGSNNIIEPYGTLVFNKPESFKKSFKILSSCGYTVYCEEDTIDNSIKLSETIEQSPIESILERKEIQEIELKEVQFLELQNEAVKEDIKIEEKSVVGEEPKQSIEERKEIQEITEEKLNKEEELLLEEKETRELILNKCKALSADILRAILREIGINSTSNNTNTLFNKLSNSEVNDELFISAYHKVADLKE